MQDKSAIAASLPEDLGYLFSLELYGQASAQTSSLFEEIKDNVDFTPDLSIVGNSAVKSSYIEKEGKCEYFSYLVKNLDNHDTANSMAPMEKRFLWFCFDILSNKAVLDATKQKIEQALENHNNDHLFLIGTQAGKYENFFREDARQWAEDRDIRYAVIDVNDDNTIAPLIQSISDFQLKCKRQGLNIPTDINIDQQHLSQNQFYLPATTQSMGYNEHQGSLDVNRALDGHSQYFYGNTLKRDTSQQLKKVLVIDNVFFSMTIPPKKINYYKALMEHGLDIYLWHGKPVKCETIEEIINPANTVEYYDQQLDEYKILDRDTTNQCLYPEAAKYGGKILLFSDYLSKLMMYSSHLLQLFNRSTITAIIINYRDELYRLLQLAPDAFFKNIKYIQCYEISIDWQDLRKLLNKAEQLTHLSLQGCRLFDKTSSEVIPQQTSVKILDLKGSHMSGECLEYLLSRFSSIETLDITDFYIRRGELSAEFIERYQRNTQIMHLRYSKEMNANTFPVVLTLCPWLEEITLDKDIEYISNLLLQPQYKQTLRSLKKLTIHLEILDTLHLLEQCQSLQTLEIIFDTINTERLSAITFPKFSQLKTIKLIDAPKAFIIELLNHCPVVETLNIIGSDDQTTNQLKQQPSLTFKSLKELRIRQNDDFNDQLPLWFENSPQLEKIELSRLTLPEGLFSNRAPLILPAIKHFTLRLSTIDTKNIEALLSGMPNLKLLMLSNNINENHTWSDGFYKTLQSLKLDNFILNIKSSSTALLELKLMIEPTLTQLIIKKDDVLFDPFSTQFLQHAPQFLALSSIVTNNVWINHELLLTLLSHAPNLQSLDISGCRNATRVFFESLTQLKTPILQRLKHLNISRTQITTKQLERLLSRCPQLETLNFDFCTQLIEPLSEEFINEYHPIDIKQPENLAVKMMSHAQFEMLLLLNPSINIIDTGIKNGTELQFSDTFIRHCKTFDALDELKIDPDMSSSAIELLLIKGIKAKKITFIGDSHTLSSSIRSFYTPTPLVFHSLETLDFGERYLTTEDLEYWLIGAPKLKNLKFLLEKSSLSPFKESFIQQYLTQKNPELKITHYSSMRRLATPHLETLLLLTANFPMELGLDLSDNRNLIQDFSNSFKQNYPVLNHIVSINLSNSWSKTNHLEALLLKIKNIKALTLDNCNFLTDPFSKEFRQGLPRLVNLEYISLGATPFSEDDLRLLLSCCPNLKYISIDSKHYSEFFKKELSAILQDCRIDDANASKTQEKLKIIKPTSQPKRLNTQQKPYIDINTESDNTKTLDVHKYFIGPLGDDTNQYRLTVAPSRKNKLTNDVKLINVTQSQDARLDFKNTPGSHLGVYPMTLDKEWQALPSLTAYDEITSYDCDLPVEFGYNAAQKLYYVRAKQQEGVCKIRFVVNIPHDILDKYYLKDQQWEDDIDLTPLKTLTLNNNGLIDQQRSKPALELLQQYDDEKKVRLLRRFFKSFTSGNTNVQSNDYYKRINALINQAKGSCRHRAQAFYEVMNALNIQASLIENDAHAFCEVELDNKSYRADFGGFRVNLNIHDYIQEELDELSYSQQKTENICFDATDQHYLENWSTPLTELSWPEQQNHLISDVTQSFTGPLANDYAQHRLKVYPGQKLSYSFHDIKPQHILRIAHASDWQKNKS